jgi:hypothetical protein
MDEKYITAISEVNRILSLMSPKDQEKIPIKFRKYLKEMSKETLGNKFQQDIPLREQEMSNEAKILLKFISDKFFIE